MSGTSDFAWLDYDSRPGALMAEASCFTFIRGRSARWAADTADLVSVEEVDWSAVEDIGSAFTEHEIGLFDESGWAVIYQWNGFPEQFVRGLVEREEVDEAVIVFWNVNSVVEFSYFRRGSMVVGFEFPDERSGADPDALLSGMDRAGVTMQTYESTDESGPAYYRSLLALAADLTGVVLGPNFLQRRLLVAMADVDE